MYHEIQMLDSISCINHVFFSSKFLKKCNFSTWQFYQILCENPLTQLWWNSFHGGFVQYISWSFYRSFSKQTWSPKNRLIFCKRKEKKCSYEKFHVTFWGKNVLSQIHISIGIDEKFCVKSKHTVYRLLSHWHLSNIVQTKNKETIWILFSGIDIRDARIWEKFCTDRECVAYAWGSKSRATAEKVGCLFSQILYVKFTSWICSKPNIPHNAVSYNKSFILLRRLFTTWILVLHCAFHLSDSGLFVFSFGSKKISGRIEAINTQMTSYAAGLHCLETHVTEYSSKQFKRK